MSRRRDREKRVRKLSDRFDAEGMWERGAFRPVVPGSREHCSHDPRDYIANGYCCPDADDRGCCNDIPF